VLLCPGVHPKAIALNINAYKFIICTFPSKNGRERERERESCENVENQS